VRQNRRRSKWRARLLELLRQELFQKVLSEQLQNGAIERFVDEVLEQRRDPHSVVEEIIGKAVEN
jgi:hypothetical protein